VFVRACECVVQIVCCVCGCMCVCVCARVCVPGEMPQQMQMGYWRVVTGEDSAKYGRDCEASNTGICKC